MIIIETIKGTMSRQTTADLERLTTAAGNLDLALACPHFGAMFACALGELTARAELSSRFASQCRD